MAESHVIPNPLEKGLSICNRLKGAESNFVRYDICRSFDIIDDKAEIESLIKGKTDFRKKYYDLFFCVDLLHRISNLDLFMNDISDSLKDGGIIIAIEQIVYHRSDKETAIAERIYRALSDGSYVNGFNESVLPHVSGHLTNGKVEGTVSDGKIIPMIEKYFNVLAIKYFGGPLFDLLLDKIIGRYNPDNERDAAILKTIIQVEQILIAEGVLKSNYAMIVAKKRSGQL